MEVELIPVKNGICSNSSSKSKRRSPHTVADCIGPSAMAHGEVFLKIGVPASMTRLPGFILSHDTTNEMSARYRICVLCGKANVHNSGVGLKTCMKPLPFLEPTFEPYGTPMRSAWRYTPNLLLNSLPDSMTRGLTRSRVWFGSRKSPCQKKCQEEVQMDGLTIQTMITSPSAMLRAVDHI